MQLRRFLWYWSALLFGAPALFLCVFLGSSLVDRTARASETQEIVLVSFGSVQGELIECG